MKLAEALIIRADLQRKVSQLKSRLKDSAKVQEGDTPAESVEELFGELDVCLSQLEQLMLRINLTNMRTLYDGESLTQMIARRDVLTLRISVMQELVKHIMETERYGRNEIRYVRTVSTSELRKEIDTYAKQLRELDLRLQRQNWSVDLM